MFRFPLFEHSLILAQMTPGAYGDLIRHVVSPLDRRARSESLQKQSVFTSKKSFLSGTGSLAPPATAMTMRQRPTDPFRSGEKSSTSGQRFAARQFRKAKGGIADRRRSLWIWGALGGAACLGLLALVNWMAIDSSKLLFSKAEDAARMGDWAAAQRYWRAINRTSAAKSTSHLGEAKACLALGQAEQAERSLHRAIRTDPSEPESWRLLLEIFRVEDRTLDAQRFGWQAFDAVQPDARRELLRQLTLAFLADLLPEEKIRTTLRRWVEADVNDVDAQVALWQRIVAQPRPGDPDRPSLLAKLEELLATYPDHAGVREVLTTSLADAGEPDRGRAILDTWPELTRDARYWRLRGRWELEYERRPQEATIAFRNALKELPQDWRSWYRLSRALWILNRHDESYLATETVRRIREVTDPLVLGPRLHAAFDHLDDPKALNDLAALCSQTRLTRLSNAWLAEAQHITEATVYSHR
jgi:tetratricopeptide (TPR) repeat protein